MQNLLVTSLHDLELDVNIGTSEKERAKKQKIKITFRLYQPGAPDYCANDSSDRYICYSALANTIKKYCEATEFRLLEYLCFQIYNLIKATITELAGVHVTTQKMYPNDNGMKYVAQCEYGDVYAENCISFRS